MYKYLQILLPLSVQWFFFLTQNIIKIFSRPNSNLSKEKKRVRSDNQASIYFPQIL